MWGALVARRRGFARPPIRPLMFGGGQERGLRPGTLAVHLIAGLGAAAPRLPRVKLTLIGARTNAQLKRALLDALLPLEIVVNGDPEHTLPHVLNFSVPGCGCRGGDRRSKGCRGGLERLRVHIPPLRTEPCAAGDGSG